MRTSALRVRRSAAAVLRAGATAAFATLLLATVLPAQPRVRKEAPRKAPNTALQDASGSDRVAIRARLDSLAAAFVTGAPSAGVSVAVVRGSDTLALRGYGYADLAERRPATAGTVYRVGSVTKQFTAAAVLQLVEQGRIGLGDPLGKYLSGYPQWRDVTIRQLLNHTSGIHSYTAVSAWQARMGDELPPDSLLAFVARDTLDFASGTSFRYNNSGYVLLGLVLERVTGLPYAELMRDRFFRPLGMRTASYCPTRTTDSVFATGYDRRGQQTVPAQPISMSSPYAAGALCMAVTDFLTWQHALTGGRVVRPATYARMASADTLTGGGAMRYGWALAPDTLAGRRVIQHGGDIPGGSAQQLWFPDDSLRVIVFSNTLGSIPNRLAGNLARAVLGAPLVREPRALAGVPLPPERRALLVGTYELKLPTGATLPLTLSAAASGDGMVAQAAGQPAFPLIYAGDDTFATEVDPSLRLTIVVEDGRATKAQLRQGGGAIEGPRRP